MRLPPPPVFVSGALFHHSESPSILEPDQLAQATDLSQLWQAGQRHYQEGQFAAAVSVWQQVADRYKEQGDDVNQAVVLNHLAATYQKLGDGARANQVIQQSLSLLGNQPKASLPLAQTLNTQGNLQFAQANPTAALETWQRAAQTYAAAGDRAGQAGSLINQAQAEQVLGFYLRARKTLNKAKTSIEQQTDPALKTTGLRSLGDTLRLVGELEQSAAVLQQSLTIAQSMGISESLSAAQLSLGNTAYAQKDLAQALAYYRTASQSSQLDIKTQALLNQLTVLIDQENRPRAEQLLPQIQTQISALPISHEAAYSRINLGRSMIRLRQELSSSLTWRQIAQWIAPAVTQAQTLKDLRAESYAKGTLGHLYEETGQWSSAEDLTQAALTASQAAEAPDISYQWDWQRGRILRAKGELEAATAAYERAFITLQALRSDLAAISPDIQFSFQQMVEPVYRDFVDLLLRSPAASQQQIREARDVLEALQLVELENFFRSACLEGQRVAIDQINQKNAAVLYPIVLKDRIEVIVSLSGQPLRHYPVSVSKVEVEKTVTQLRRFLEKPYTAPEGQRLGQTLYRWLIQPAQSDLAQVNTLVFVLDGSLRNVPMAALYDGSQYLIERYSLALAPGLQLLAPRPLETQELKVLAGGLAESRYGYPPLVNVRKELAEIKATVPTHVLLDRKFTSEALQQEVQSASFPVVHLATHGEFSSNADGTFILAYDRPIQISKLNELLRSSEQQRSQPIELLVLSACKTAAGDQRAVLGLAGVAVQAGARSTLASLWYLDDASGAQFISAFYRELKSGTLNKAEALRQAQLSLLKDPDYRHPANWAPYVLVGNWL
ncbi:MAG: CHAT domain-containing protein [Thermosynechococcaceae cyanobacterium]